MRPTERSIPPTRPTTHRDPLGAYPAQFYAYLERQQYSPATITEYHRCLAVLSGQMKAHRVRVKELDEKRAVELTVKAESQNAHAQHRRYIVKQFLRFLNSIGVLEPQLEVVEATGYDSLKRDYATYLRRQQGLSESTIGARWHIVNRFLQFRFGPTLGALTEITAADIVAFLQHVTTPQPVPRNKTLVSHLRNFSRYLFQTGQTTSNLAVGIPRITRQYGKRLPRHLTPAQVEQLLEAVRTDPTGGRRNYAMVLLLARLGLRAPEVVALQLEDVDWRSGELLVRGKGQRYDRVPLPPDVGEALATYIQYERPTTTRALFVTARAPHQAFKDGQILNAILRTAFTRTGLKPPTPYVGSHLLRHSLATTLVQQGASLEEISDMLRHRSRASTLIYAKLDVEGLRSIAQPWPIAGGAA